MDFLHEEIRKLLILDFLAPKIDVLAINDQIDFFGEYEWNEKGGGASTGRIMILWKSMRM